MSNPEVHITLFDTTARDGAQSLPEQNQFPDGTKYIIANEVARLGMGVIESGFPRTPSDAEEIEIIAKTIGQDSFKVSEWVDGVKAHDRQRPPIIAGLCRIDPVDIEVGWEAVQSAKYPRIHTFVSTDDHHREAKFPGVSRTDLVRMARWGVAYAKEISANSPNASTEFSAEAASTTPMLYLEKVMRAAMDEGADIINMPDTVGQRNPMSMYEYYKRIIGWVIKTNPEVVVSAHNHNDLGLAVANTYMLVSAAAYQARKHNQIVRIQLETTICGTGERAGNADIFPVVAGLFKFSPEEPVPIRWQFNPENAVRAATTIMSLAGLEVHRQNPIVGRDIMRHRSGIHSDGVLKGGHQMYTPFSPTFWGHQENAVHETGKYQGKAGNAAAQNSGT